MRFHSGIFIDTLWQLLMIINNDEQQVADTVVLEGTQNIWKEFSEELSNIFRGPEVLF